MVKRIIERACAALEWDNLTVKADLVIDGNLVWVIELAPRLSGGFFASHIIPNNTGWNVIADAAALACGDKPPVRIKKHKKYHRPVVQRYFFPKPEWIGKRIVHLPGVSEIERRIVERSLYRTHVICLTWNYRNRDIIRPVKSHPDRLGQITVRDDDGFIQSAMEKVMERIIVE